MRETILIILFCVALFSCRTRIDYLRNVQPANTNKAYSYVSDFSHKKPILVEIYLNEQQYISESNEQLDSVLLVYNYLLDLKKGRLLQGSVHAPDNCKIRKHVLDDIGTFFFKNLSIETTGSFILNPQYKNVRGEPRMHKYGFVFTVKNDSILLQN